VFLLELPFRYSIRTAQASKSSNNGVVRVNILDTQRSSRGIVYVCCPEVSLFEWHPFSLVSDSFSRTDSFYFKISGDWTRKFANTLGVTPDGRVPVTKCKLYIDGPYKSIQDKVVKDLVTKRVLVIATGMALSSFMTCIKEYAIFNGKNMVTVWITRSIDFDIPPTIKVLLTGESRPDIPYELDKLHDINAFEKVYYSGNKNVEKTIQAWSKAHSISFSSA
jgi:hypothetical protein